MNYLIREHPASCIVKLRLCYCFENGTSSGENLHIVPLKVSSDAKCYSEEFLGVPTIVANVY